MCQSIERRSGAVDEKRVEGNCVTRAFVSSMLLRDNSRRMKTTLIFAR